MPSDIASADGPKTLELSDGRRLSYAVYGDRAGKPVVCLHGTPGSRIKFAIADGSARQLGIRLIAPDRWGYGDSDAPSERSLVGYAKDIGALIEHLHLDQPIGVFGISGGGPFATAIAAHLPSQTRALALAAPVSPIAGSALGDTSAFHAFCFRVLPFLPGATRSVFSIFRRVLQTNRAAAVKIASLRAARVDKDILAVRETRDDLGRAFQVGLQRSADGPVIDLELFGRPWDFDVADISAPTRIWLGRCDTHVPIKPAARLAERVQDGDLVDIADGGHFWVVPNHGEILSWLARALKSSR